MIGLQRAHGPAIDAGQARDAKFLPQQATLGVDVIGDGDERRISQRVGRGGGQAIAEHVHDDDAVFCRVQDLVGTDQPFQVRVLGAVAGGVEDWLSLAGDRVPWVFQDRVAFGRVAPAVRGSVPCWVV